MWRSSVGMYVTKWTVSHHATSICGLISVSEKAEQDKKQNKVRKDLKFGKSKIFEKVRDMWNNLRCLKNGKRNQILKR